MPIIKVLYLAAFLTTVSAYSVSVVANSTKTGNIAIHPSSLAPKSGKAPKPGPNDSICDAIDSILPPGCSCSPRAGGGGLAQCQVDILGLDVIGVSMDLEPCALPMSFGLDITESDLGIDYPIAGLTAGSNEEVPIPGLSIDIQGFPVEAGVTMTINIAGNIQALTLSIGVDACVDVPFVGKQCGSELGVGLPIWLLNTEFDFGDLCSSQRPKKA